MVNAGCEAVLLKLTRKLRALSAVFTVANRFTSTAVASFKMSLLYLIKFTIEYKGIPQKQFIKTWATEAEVALKAKEKGKILQIWKVNE